MAADTEQVQRVDDMFCQYCGLLPDSPTAQTREVTTASIRFSSSTL